MTNPLTNTIAPSSSLSPALTNPMDLSNPYSQESPQAIAYTRGRIARANGAEKVVPSGLLYQQPQAWREGYQREAWATGPTIAQELSRFPQRLARTPGVVLASSQGRISK